MRCLRCGQENASGVSLCTKCGATLEIPPTPWNEEDEITQDPSPSGGPARNLTSATPPKAKPPTIPPQKRRVAPPIEPKKKLIGTGDLPALNPSRVDPLSTAIEPRNRDATSPWGEQKSRAVPPPNTRNESQTDQVPIDSLLGKVRGGEQPRAPRAPWDQAIAQAPSSTLRKWGTTPEAEAETVPRVNKPAVMPKPPVARYDTEATETSLPKWSDPQGDHGTAPTPMSPKPVDDALRARAMELAAKEKKRVPEAPSRLDDRSRTEPTGARLLRPDEPPKRPEPTGARISQRPEPTGARITQDPPRRADPAARTLLDEQRPEPTGARITQDPLRRPEPTGARTPQDVSRRPDPTARTVDDEGRRPEPTGARAPQDALRRPEPTGARISQDETRRPEPTGARISQDPLRRPEPTGARISQDAQRRVDPTARTANDEGRSAGRIELDDLRAAQKPIEAPSVARANEPPPRKVSLPPFTPRPAPIAPKPSEPPRSGFPDKTAPVQAFGPQNLRPPSPERTRPPAADTLPPQKPPTASKAPPQARLTGKFAVPAQETVALPWEVASADLPSPELKNAPVMMPERPHILTADLDLPPQKPSDVSAPSGTMVGVLSPIEPPSGAGDLTRVAPEGALAGPRPAALPPSAATSAGDLVEQPKPRATTDDDPGFSHAPSFDDPASEDPWVLREAPAPQESLRPPLEETRAFEALPQPASLIFGANERTAPLLPQGEAPELKLQLASGIRRFGAAVIDLALILAAFQGVALTGLLGAAWAAPLPADPDQIAATIAKNGPIYPLATIGALLVLGSILSVGLIGRSPGKLLFGIRVVTKKTGKKPGILRATIRALLSLISLAFAGMGYLWSIVDRERRTLHEVATGTTTVRSRALP